MNRKHLLTAVALALLGTSAMASGEFDPLRDTTVPGAKSSTLNRTQVAAAPANANLDLNPLSSLPARSTLTRAQVRAEFIQARREGSLVSFEPGTPDVQAVQGTSRSREDVRAETQQALRTDRHRTTGF